MNLSHLPNKLTGPAAWLGQDMARNEDRWLYRLSAQEIAELEQAARHYLSLGRDVG